jgi:predicted nucleic acid-binding protein
MTKISLDTNILIYSHDKNDLHKQDIARTLLDLDPVISTQTVSEYFNVLKRKIAIPKYELIDLCMENLNDCIIHPVDISTLKIAKHIIQRYDLQIFDGIIVASAIEANCEILYSEDMQHGLLVEKRMKIINPFI